MGRQDFDRISPELLPEVERLVVAEHEALHRDLRGEAWSPPHAYRWIRYEDPDPIGRLIAASERLEALWAAHPEAGDARARFADWEAERLRDLPTL